MTRGRNARTPLEIPPKGWKDILFRVKDEISEDHVGLISAGVAFYSLMALFPAITAVIALGGLLVDPPQIVDMIAELKGIVPEEVLTIITDQAAAVAGSHEGGLGLTVLVGILIAIYSASKGVGSLMEGMNVAYDEEETRGFFVKTLVTLSLTVGAILAVIFGLFVIAGATALAALDRTGQMMEILILLASLAILATLMTLMLAIFYRYGPSRDNAEWAWLTPGTIGACVIWVLASSGFGFYVANFGSYNDTFGTMAGIIVLLMWLWISAYVVMFGAELNAEIEAQTRHDTTVGRDEPMGQRDALKADKLGEAAV